MCLHNAPNDSHWLAAVAQLFDDPQLDQFGEPVDPHVAPGNTVVHLRLDKSDPLPGRKLLYADANHGRRTFNCDADDGV